MVETSMHDRVDLVEPQSKDKGKAIILETPKPPKPKMRKSQVMTLLDEPPSITFEMLRSNGILKPKYAGSYDPSSPFFNPKKHCAFHSEMPGHDTDECRQLRRDVQNLIGNGRIVQKPRPQLIWYQPPKIIPTSNYTQLTPRTQTIWYPPPPIAPTSYYIPASYPQPVFTAYPYGQTIVPRGKVNQKKPRYECSISTGFVTLTGDSTKLTTRNLKKRHD